MDNWTGCYREGWGKHRLRPESFAHPAKNSYGLSVRIYEHALEQGWVKAGDYVVDCFSGVGGFALEAMRHGLHFRGVELEQRFVDMGQGCDCTGISKADWVRFQGRWDKARYQDGRHWCPECIMRASAVTNEREFKALPLPGTKWAAIAKMRQPAMFGAAPTTSYVRNSGVIPCTGAHRYHGNVETWEAQGMPGSAVIVQGDSRRLGAVLERPQICLSSPPYSGNFKSDRTHGRRDERRLGAGFTGRGRGCFRGSETYGRTEGQLGNLPDAGYEAALGQQGHTVTPEKPGNAVGTPGDMQAGSQEASTVPESRPVLAVASPPYSRGTVHGGSGIDADKLTGNTPGRHSQALIMDGYGQQPGQLAQMPKGDLAEIVEYGIGQYGPRHRDMVADEEYYNQLGREQSPALAISSPPWQGSLSRDNVTEGRVALAREKGVGVHLISPVEMEKIGKRTQNYSAADGQLAALLEGDHAEACERPVIAISSPPFGGAAQHTGGKPASLFKQLDGRNAPRNLSGMPTGEGYGSEEGQLGQMPPGDYAEALEAGAAACISSPPREKAGTNYGCDGDVKFAQEWQRMHGKRIKGGPMGLWDKTYGNTTGQLGQETGSTFWAASRQILEEVYQVLAPGGHAIWVLKMFVRNKKLVDFPGQWETLCQSVGFRTVCKHRAWLNKNAGIVQTTLDGDEVSMEKWFKSFFRRLCESKGSPRIDWELVLCMVKE